LLHGLQARHPQFNKKWIVGPWLRMANGMTHGMFADLRNQNMFK
jgi:hypothetical protein